MSKLRDFNVNKWWIDAGAKVRSFGIVVPYCLLHPDRIKQRTMNPCAEKNMKSVRRSKEEKKVLRKQLKTSYSLLKHEGVSTVSQPTKVSNRKRHL